MMVLLLMYLGICSDSHCVSVVAMWVIVLVALVGIFVEVVVIAVAVADGRVDVTAGVTVARMVAPLVVVSVLVVHRYCR